MGKRPVAAIILAAGKGTRMKSDLHKVLHKVAGQPMIRHLLNAVDSFAPERTIVVVGAGREQVAARVPEATLVVQEPQLGTAHAVLMAKAAMQGFAGDVLILYGDAPMVQPATMQAMMDALHKGPKPPAIVVLTVRPADPAAYGRVILADDGSIAKMVEYKDATPEQRAVGLCNSGIMAVRGELLFTLLEQVDNTNAQAEYYLPDIVMLAARIGHSSASVETCESEVAGINSREDLSFVEAQWQASRRTQAMADGATLIDPASVFFSFDTVIGRDVVIEPHVFFGPGVHVADHASIHGFSHLEGCTVGEGSSVGPFARLRPGAVLYAKAKVGNFVEIKQSVLEAGAKVNHLSYIGDAHVGADANIGAGTITCNYDGFFKYKTTIGKGAFIGSNAALVAPVTIGDGAIVGAGSVVTQDVSADALALVRPQQSEKTGWAKRFREVMKARKKDV